MNDKRENTTVDEGQSCFSSGAMPHYDLKAEADTEPKAQARILVLGANCPKCRALEQAVLRALDEMNANISVGHVTDYAEMAKFGVMSTPALVIDNRVVSAGRALNQTDVLRLLKANL